ncbi:1,3-beta-glucan synthase subunit FKS1, domain-1-domain-containing protein [Gautieria morchelliformis]|nr:1,3-beta-glucan synthase subunit FKS1, domain-1-domain-containing protein [Gautieria morchelliformis]
MNNISQPDPPRQLALYLLCWAEAAQVRFVLEYLCSIFKCADDYYRSPECRSRIEPVSEGHYRRAPIKPLPFHPCPRLLGCRRKVCTRKKDHDQIICYVAVNQPFWYPEGVARILITEKTRHVRNRECEAVMLCRQSLNECDHLLMPSGFRNNAVHALIPAVREVFVEYTDREVSIQSLRPFLTGVGEGCSSASFEWTKEEMAPLVVASDPLPGSSLLCEAGETWLRV